MMGYCGLCQREAGHCFFDAHLSTAQQFQNGAACLISHCFRKLAILATGDPRHLVMPSVSWRARAALEAGCPTFTSRAVPKPRKQHGGDADETLSTSHMAIRPRGCGLAYRSRSVIGANFQPLGPITSWTASLRRARCPRLSGVVSSRASLGHHLTHWAPSSSS